MRLYRARVAESSEARVLDRSARLALAVLLAGALDVRRRDQIRK